MTRDDIIRMAREAGSIDSEEVIETVYAANAAAEREALCQWVEAEFASYERADAVVAAIRTRGKK